MTKLSTGIAIAGVALATGAHAQANLTQAADAKTACADALVTTGDDGYGAYGDSQYVCRHGHFLTAFGIGTRTPDWSAYRITGDEVRSEKGGRRTFRQDPDITEDKQADIHSPCWGETWNRGHLAPSHILSYSHAKGSAWYDCYIITNTAMQSGAFNQQSWEHVEEHVIDWIKAHKTENEATTKTENEAHKTENEATTDAPAAVAVEDAAVKDDKDKTSVYIITGTLFEDLKSGKATRAAGGDRQCNLGTGDVKTGYALGKHNDHKQDGELMGVPDYYYKVLCDPAAKQSIAYIGKNLSGEEGGGADSNIVEVSVGAVEKRLSAGGDKPVVLFPAEHCGDKSTFDKSYWFELSARVLGGNKKAAADVEQETQAEQIIIN